MERAAHSIRVKPLSWAERPKEINRERLLCVCSGAPECKETLCPHYEPHNWLDECGPGLCTATAELNKVQCGGPRDQKNQKEQSAGNGGNGGKA